MKITVIPSDRWIRRDNDAANLPTWPFDDADIHAIQWYNDSGEIEFDGTPKPANQLTSDISVVTPYLEALDAYLASVPEPEEPEE
jgi:hypothetical protein